MQIDFVRSGGFAGMRLAASLDTQNPPSAAGANLEKLVADAAFFELPAEIRSASPGADRFEYRITIAAGQNTHVVSLQEAAMPDPLRPLIEQLTALAQSQRGK